MRTGIIFGDATLGQLVVANPAEREHVLEAGLSSLVALPGIHGLRLLIPPNGYEERVLRKISANHSLEFSTGPAENHSVLPLSPTYESFMGGLGSRTRRNFRYYRRRFEAAGHHYAGDLRIRDFQIAAESLSERNVIGAKKSGLDRALKLLRAVPKPLLAGLAGKDGTCLSILGGWLEWPRATVFLQMNDDFYHADLSLSLVLRSYLIEDLITQGYRDLVFWAGVGPPISHYTKPIPTRKVFVDKRNKGWQAIRRALAAARPVLPDRYGCLLDWV